jgi:hypothetical protein
MTLENNKSADEAALQAVIEAITIARTIIVAGGSPEYFDNQRDQWNPSVISGIKG